MASNTESDDDLNEYMERWEQQGGALRRGHYQFKRVKFRERQAKRYGITRTSYHLLVENPPESFSEGHGNIVRAFEEGLSDVIEDLTESMPDHDRIQIYLSSNRLQSAHTSANVTVGDWRDPLSGARRILDQISKMLNSNENFQVADSLQLDVTHITMPTSSLTDDYYHHEGIRLDPNKIEDNPGLRKVAKLDLNNFWGKFGQQDNQTQVTTCIKPSEFFTMLQDDAQLIHRVEIVNEDMIHIYHSYDGHGV